MHRRYRIHGIIASSLLSMKFKYRLVLFLLGIVGFSYTGMLIHSNHYIHHDRSHTHGLDFQAMRRSLNVAESSSREVAGLLGQILDHSGLVDSGAHAWQRLLRNRTIADAWIKVGNVLDQRRRDQDNQMIPGADGVIAGDPWSGSHGDQDAGVPNIGVINKTIVRDLTSILYTSLGYVTANRQDEEFKEPLQMFKGMEPTRGSPSYQRFQTGIRRYSLYSDYTDVNDLLRDMVLQPITEMVQMDSGTQIKLMFTLADSSKVVFKPMRFPRSSADTLPNHFYFSDYERHTAEIAAFHLDRLLDFRKVPPVAGRVVNITQDIWRLAHSDKKFEKTIFISPAGNICFHGKCDYYCDTGHAICGHPDLLEGSMATFLPSSDTALRNRWRHPWRRSYSKRRKAKWETDPDFCDKVMVNPPYSITKRILDIMDIAVFDFLIGNMDRHHYETFRDFQNDTFTLLFDNGRAFGKPGHDELTIMAPIYQCCMIRASTIHKLLKLHTGDKLSIVMQRSLANDLLPDVLTQRHLAALDRRVEKLLLVVHQCVADNGEYNNVIIDDGF